MDAPYVNAVLTGIKQVFSTMLGMSVSFENPITKIMRHPNFDINSRIGISGAFKGCMVLSMPQAVAVHIAETMLENFEIETDENLIDAIGEIANMIIGSADTAMECENVIYSLPTVTLGKEQVIYPEDSFIFSMACLLNTGNFDVDIALSDTS